MLIGVQRLFLGTLKLMVGVHVSRDTFFVSLIHDLQELTLIHFPHREYTIHGGMHYNKP